MFFDHRSNHSNTTSTNTATSSITTTTTHTATEQVLLTIDPFSAEFLNKQTADNAQVMEFIKKNNYTWVPPTAVKVYDRGTSKERVVAMDRIPMGSILIYDGCIKFILKNSNKHAVLHDPAVDSVVPDNVTMHIMETDVEKEVIPSILFAPLREQIIQTITQGKYVIPTRVGLIWHKPSHAWYLVLTNQLTNASATVLADLPELVADFQSVNINIINLPYEGIVANKKEYKLTLEIILKFIQSKHPLCNDATFPIMIGIDGTHAVMPCAYVSHCPYEDMTTATSSANVYFKYFKLDNHLFPILLGIVSEDIEKGNVLTRDHGPAAALSISAKQMVFWDKTGQPMNPLLALRSLELHHLTQKNQSYLLFQTLMTSGVDELWVLMKNNPIIFHTLMTIANTHNINLIPHINKEHMVDNLYAIKTASEIYKEYIGVKWIKELSVFPLLPTVLSQDESVDFAQSPHSAINFLRNASAVEQMREQAKQATFNWFRYFKTIHYIDPNVGSKADSKTIHVYANRCDKNFTLGKQEYDKKTPQGTEQAILYWQRALGDALVEAWLRRNARTLYQHGKNRLVNNRTTLISWNLANAYKRIEDYKNALYFFNFSEKQIQLDPSWGKNFDLAKIQLHSQACRQALDAQKAEQQLISQTKNMSFGSSSY